MISEKEIGYTNNITIEMKIRSTMHLMIAKKNYELIFKKLLQFFIIL